MVACVPNLHNMSFTIVLLASIVIVSARLNKGLLRKELDMPLPAYCIFTDDDTTDPQTPKGTTDPNDPKDPKDPNKTTTTPSKYTSLW